MKLPNPIGQLTEDVAAIRAELEPPQRTGLLSALFRPQPLRALVQGMASKLDQLAADTGKTSRQLESLPSRVSGALFGPEIRPRVAYPGAALLDGIEAMHDRLDTLATPQWPRAVSERIESLDDGLRNLDQLSQVVYGQATTIINLQREIAETRAEARKAGITRAAQLERIEGQLELLAMQGHAPRDRAAMRVAIDATEVQAPLAELASSMHERYAEVAAELRAIRAYLRDGEAKGPILQSLEQMQREHAAHDEVGNEAHDDLQRAIDELSAKLKPVMNTCVWLEGQLREDGPALGLRNLWDARTDDLHRKLDQLAEAITAHRGNTE